MFSTTNILPTPIKIIRSNNPSRLLVLVYSSSPAFFRIRSVAVKPMNKKTMTIVDKICISYDKFPPFIMSDSKDTVYSYILGMFLNFSQKFTILAINNQRHLNLLEGIPSTDTALSM